MQLDIMGGCDQIAAAQEQGILYCMPIISIDLVFVTSVLFRLENIAVRHHNILSSQIIKQ